MTADRAASVRARLLNIAKATGVDFNQVLVRFALERLLYRLSRSAHADRFVLKCNSTTVQWSHDFVNGRQTSANTSAPSFGTPPSAQ